MKRIFEINYPDQLGRDWFNLADLMGLIDKLADQREVPMLSKFRMTMKELTPGPTPDPGSLRILAQWFAVFSANAACGPAVMPDGTVRQFAIEATTISRELTAEVEAIDAAAERTKP